MVTASTSLAWMQSRTEHDMEDAAAYSIAGAGARSVEAGWGGESPPFSPCATM